MKWSNDLSLCKPQKKLTLVVHINSFAFKKGLPEDKSDNGGGFVFDCRGILNPGRYLKNSKNKLAVIKKWKIIWNNKPKCQVFWNSNFDVVDITVEDYIRRNFSSLMVSFGCTGGQHRSVYAADALARHLRNKFKVKIELHTHWAGKQKLE